MSIKIKIKKGLDIPVAGKASEQVSDCNPSLIGIVPDDFPGYKWRPVVKPGDNVIAGQPLLESKEADDIRLVSPVSGTVAEIRRGERRRILAVTVCPSDSPADECVSFGIPAQIPEKLAATTGPLRIKLQEFRDTTRAALKNSGLWAFMRQRPFDIVPLAESEPRDIFITAFDSAPLAPDIAADLDKSDIAKGLQVLDALTDGKVYLACRPDAVSELEIVANQKAVILSVCGPHPAGNCGPQIAAVSPVAKGETVWTLDIRTLARIGFLFNTDTLDFSTTLAVAGPEVNDPHLIRSVCGASAADLLRKISLKENTEQRVISGNVLTGAAISAEDGFLRFPYRQITVIEEGEHVDEFMGWASLSPKKFSVKRMLPAGLFRIRRPFRFDSRILGGHRAMILADELDSVFPFDIYAEYLLKATMVRDYDRMERLGIYEVAPEDFALPEFIDTSKEPLQKIVRDGLDSLREEM